MPDDLLDGKESSPEECAVCDLGLAVVGLVIGAVFLYISFDVLTKGAITRALTRSVNV